jgi:hypothetical protein
MAEVVAVISILMRPNEVILRNLLGESQYLLLNMIVLALDSGAV